MMLVVSMCIPKFNNNYYEINAFAKELCSDIRYIRSNNTLGNLNTYITLVQDSNKQGYVLIDKGKNIKEKYLPSDTSIHNNTTSKKIYFRNDGSPNPSGSTIQIKNSIYKKEITIVPVSGRVLFKEEEYEK